MKKNLNLKLIKLDPAFPEPLYLQLANELQTLASCSSINSLIKLPSQRELSDLLKLDRSTIRRAYNELLRREVVEYKSAYHLYFSPETKKKTLQPFPNIGIVIPQQFSHMVENSGGAVLRYFSGIIDSAARKNIGTLMLQLPAPDASKETISTYLDGLSDRLLGIIHIGERGYLPDYPLQALLKDKRINQLIISAFPIEADIGIIIDDPTPGSRALAEHLIQFGHKNIGFIIWTDTWEIPANENYFTYASYERPKKLLKTFLEYGLNCFEEHQLFACTSYNAIQEKIRQLIDKQQLPDMFCCCNDETAGWTIEVLEKEGLKVPEDISVVGYDGLPTTSYFDKLTTLNMPFYAIGVKAVEQLLEYHYNGLNNENKLSELQTSLVLKKTLSFCRKHKI